MRLRPGAGARNLEPVSVSDGRHTARHSTQKPQSSQNNVGSGFPPSLRFRLRAKRSGATSTKLEERSRVGEARRSARRGGGSRIGKNPPKRRTPRFSAGSASSALIVVAGLSRRGSLG